MNKPQQTREYCQHCRIFVDDKNSQHRLSIQHRKSLVKHFRRMKEENLKEKRNSN